MSSSPASGREVAVPVSVFETLRTELEREAGTLQAVRAMHHAGYGAGLAAAGTLNRDAGGDAFALRGASFWSLLSGYCEKRGWGSLRHEAVHPAVGLLISSDWAESSPAAPGEQGACNFSSGFLSGVLSQLAGGAVAVLEVRCRSRGDADCAFAFGSETAIHDLYGHLLETPELERALQAL